jgi:hypothetical protein
MRTIAKQVWLWTIASRESRGSLEGSEELTMRWSSRNRGWLLLCRNRAGDLVLATAEPRRRKQRELETQPCNPPERPKFWMPVIPIFGCQPYTPNSPCAHRGPLPAGSMFYCPQCQQTGWDFHPDMAVDERERPVHIPFTQGTLWGGKN